MKSIKKHDQEFMKKSNMSMILDLIRNKKPISRVDLAKLTNMSPTSVSRIVGELQELGLVKETELRSNGIGRKAILLDTDSRSVLVVGVDLDQTLTKVGLVDFDGHIILEKRISYPMHSMTAEGIADRIAQIIEEIVEETQIDSAKIIGMGIGIPGIIDSKQGIVVFSSQLGWKNESLAKHIKDRVPIKTTIDNEVKLKALAENSYGSAKGSDKVALIALGSGVGSALIVNGEIFKGKSNSAGEIGHTTVDPNGILCDCGRRGCLQTYIAEWALIQEARKVKDISGIKEIFEAAKQNEGWAISILERALTYIGIVITNIVCMYNPDTIILSGSLVEENPEMLNLIKDKAEQLIWEPLRGTYKIEYTHLKGQAIILGATTSVLNKFLNIDL